MSLDERRLCKETMGRKNGCNLQDDVSRPNGLRHMSRRIINGCDTMCVRVRHERISDTTKVGRSQTSTGKEVEVL